MISASDLIQLPYTPDLTRSGIVYACRSLPYTYNRMGGSDFARLRRIVAGVGVELAMRRYLAGQGVPFDVRGATPFTDPDRYDISLGGHRCDLKSFLITHRAQIAAIRHDPSIVLEAPALIPSDQFAAATHSDRDVYLFAFLGGLVANSRADRVKARASGQPLYEMAAMPPGWMRPPAWVPLDGLTMKSECARALEVEIGGQNAERDFITVTLELPPRQRIRVPETFYSLAYVHTGGQPDARIGLHSPVRGAAHLIAPEDWGNIWVYGMHILLVGYITREEFRRRAEQVAEGARVFQYRQTRTKNLAVRVADLHPVGELFEKVIAWGKRSE